MTATRIPAPAPTAGMRPADVATVPTPFGPFTTIVATDGAVLASGWTDTADDLQFLIHPTLRPGALRVRTELGAVTDAVLDYHRGDHTAIDDVAVRQQSGVFLCHAWDVLRTVAPGAPISYASFAARAGRPAATRAAANACGRNAVALFVPCHRVLRADGSLGGFRWGPTVKRRLLEHEARG